MSDCREMSGGRSRRNSCHRMRSEKSLFSPSNIKCVKWAEVWSQFLDCHQVWPPPPVPQQLGAGDRGWGPYSQPRLARMTWMRSPLLGPAAAHSFLDPLQL